ncbi:MAG: right-handed parallel beta-helix repeat-containing protein [Bacteroidetes bacterium]|nr:right-handed parallel beta-helix repeat-containing protein [Bacteroidota bacterium]
MSLFYTSSVSVDIRNTEFINNNCGILLGHTYYAKIKNNSFTGPLSRMETYGLYMEACTGYKVENNSFTGGDYGIYIKNSGSNSNEIYKNTISSQEIGIMLEGDNRNLQLRCNIFDDIDYTDIGMDGQVSSQGSCSSILKPANNLLSHDCTGIYGDIWRNPDPSGINIYYRYQNSSAQTTKPFCYSPIKNDRFSIEAVKLPRSFVS